MFSGHRKTRVTESTLRRFGRDGISYSPAPVRSLKRATTAFLGASGTQNRFSFKDCPVLVLRHLRSFQFKIILEVSDWIKACEIHHGKGANCTPVVIHSFEHQGHSTIWLGSTPIFEGKHPGGGHRPPTSVSLRPASRENLRPDGYLEYLHDARALYIYKQLCHFRDSNPEPTAPQSAALFTTHRM
ncbi:uncharacterized protein TNCV_1896931 [Trichonephila clavipes]|nr:uncharacterized protein TNCV_1896931 [Trichonephila clavipes]